MMEFTTLIPNLEMKKLRHKMVKYISQGAKLLINRPDNLISKHANSHAGLLIINLYCHSFARGIQTRGQSSWRLDKQEEETGWDRQRLLDPP